jgi:lysophospholipase L1-like esterase
MATLSSTGRFAAGETCADNDILYGPYATTAAAHAALLNAEQNVVGRTVGIQTGNTIEEFWYQGGTEQTNLVKKQSSDVEANPSGEATTPLNKIKIGDTNYNIPQTDTSNLATKEELQQGLSGKQDTISDLQQIRTRADEGHTALQPKQSGQYTQGNIVVFDANGGLKDSNYKASDFVQQVTVGTTTTGAAGTNASVTNRGTQSAPVFDFTIPRGADAVNPFKGWFNAVVTGEAGSRVITSETQNLPSNPIVGDYAYVKTWDISGTAPSQTETPIAKIYECSTAGSWSDSGRTADTSNVQTFASGEEVNDVHIVKDFSGGVGDVASAETVKTLKHNVDEIGRVIDSNALYNLFVKTETQIADSRIDGSGSVVSQNGATVSYKIPIIAGETYARYYSSGKASNCYVRFLDASDNKLKPLNPSDDSEMGYNTTGINGVFKAPATAAYLQFCINNGQNGDINSAVVIKASSLPSPLVYVDGPYAKVAPNAIGEAQLANSAVTGEKIADISIPAGKLQAGAVIGGNIATNVVGENNMVNGSITQSKLSNSIKIFKAGSYDKSAYIKELFLDIAGLSVTSCSFQCSALGSATLYISGDGYQIRSTLYPTENDVLYSLKVDYSEHQSFSIGDIIGYVVFSDYSSFIGTLDGSSAKNNVNVGFTSVASNFPIIFSYKLRGKSIIFTGDSICQASTDFQNGGGWAKRIGEKNGMKWENKGISGGTIINKDLVNSTFTISETDFGTGADYIILEGGVNDADKIGSILNNNIPSLFGSFSWSDYQSIFTNDTFCGAVEKLIKGVVTSYPDAKVGFIIPMKMGVNFVDGYQKETNNRRAYFEIIIEICRKWGVPVLNLWDNCTMNPDIASHYTSGDGHLYVDGVHPTGYGYDFLAPIIESWIKSL